MDRLRDILLHNGLHAIVDDEDYGYLSQFHWFAVSKRGVFYARRDAWFDGRAKSIYMHREVMRANTDEYIDHVNHDGLDNRRGNLRKCSMAQNGWNSKKRRNSLTQYKGIWKHNATHWRAAIRCNGQRFNLGLFSTAIDAAKAYDQKAKELFGEFAHINFREP